MPVEPAEPTIQVSMKTYSALKVGYSISDNLLGGQKAKFQVKCGKNDNVKLVLNANPDDLTIKIEGTDAAFVQDAEGTYSIELNDVAFRKFTIILSAKQDLAFSLSAEAADDTVVEGEEEDINEEDINKEETESIDETTEQAEEENIKESERKISFTHFWDDEEPSIGSIVHMQANVTGYEGTDYVLQWQYSEDPDAMGWTDYPGANSENFDLQITEENNNFFWRVCLFLK